MEHPPQDVRLGGDGVATAHGRAAYRIARDRANATNARRRLRIRRGPREGNRSPGDDFCTVWHRFDLLPEGADDWAPKFTYG
jgi:hypothetical protein